MSQADTHTLDTTYATVHFGKANVEIHHEDCEKVPAEAVTTGDLVVDVFRRRAFRVIRSAEPNPDVAGETLVTAANDYYPRSEPTFNWSNPEGTGVWIVKRDRLDRFEVAS